MTKLLARAVSSLEISSAMRCSSRADSSRRRVRSASRTSAASEETRRSWSLEASGLLPARSISRVASWTSPDSSASSPHRFWAMMTGAELALESGDVGLDQDGRAHVLGVAQPVVPARPFGGGRHAVHQLADPLDRPDPVALCLGLLRLS